jgi:tripartite-type tricarboxylate transporter receptor subunit TctC
MFKKLSVALAMTLTLCLAQARETITIVWGFNIGSNQANTVRILCEELNSSQDRYTFVIGHRPGAGGSIAANYVDSNPENTVVSMSSSFIIRPYFEKNQATHNLDDFVPILVQGVGTPLYFVSKKYTSIEQVIQAPNASIGISGHGTISHLAANEVSKINKSTVIANYQSSVDAATAAAGGHVDVAIAFYMDVNGLIDSNLVRIIGATGSPNIDKNLLLTTHKLKDAAALTANYAIYSSRKMSPERFRDLHDLFVKANSQPAVLASYAKDELRVINLNPKQSSEWYSGERAYWDRQVKLINK